MMNCQVHHRDQILLYVADALDESQRHELEAHLQTGCSVCAAHVAEAETTLGCLPLALAPAEPPRTAKTRLMERVRGVEGVEQGEPVRSAPDAGLPALVERTPDGGGRLLGRIVPLAIAAGVAMAVTLGVLYVPIHEQRERIADLEQQLRLAGDDVVEPEAPAEPVGSLVDGTTQIFESLQSSALQFISLRAEEQTYAEAVARLLWDEEGNVCHLFASRLREPEEGKAYRLWLTSADGRMIPAGTFDLDDEGDAHFELGVPEDARPIAQAGISYGDADAPHEQNDQSVPMIFQGHLRP